MNADSLSAAPPRPSYRKVEQFARRRRILDEAEAVFSARGYYEASITEIAIRAGLAAGTIYLYFRDKADLYGSVIVEKMNEIVSKVETALRSDRSAKISLHAAVHAFFAYHESNRQFFELFLHQQQMAKSPLNGGHWREMEELKRRNLDAIERCIVRGQRNGELKPGDARLYAVAFLGIILQMIRQRIREQSKGDVSASVDFVADCFLYGATQIRS